MKRPLPEIREHVRFQWVEKNDFGWACNFNKWFSMTRLPINDLGNDQDLGWFGIPKCKAFGRIPQFSSPLLSRCQSHLEWRTWFSQFLRTAKRLYDGPMIWKHLKTSSNPSLLELYWTTTCFFSMMWKCNCTRWIWTVEVFRCVTPLFFYVDMFFLSRKSFTSWLSLPTSHVWFFGTIRCSRLPKVTVDQHGSTQSTDSKCCDGRSACNILEQGAWMWAAATRNQMAWNGQKIGDSSRKCGTKNWCQYFMDFWWKHWCLA